MLHINQLDDVYSPPMKIRLRVCIGILLLSLPLVLLAADVTGLYDTTVIAKGQAKSDRNMAIKRALSVVLSRLIAPIDMQSSPGVKSMLNNAARYVRQYSYQSIEEDASGEDDRRYLKVTFDEIALREALRSSKIKAWYEARPEILLWFAVEQGKSRRFFSPDIMPVFNRALRNASRNKGLPVLLPLIDISDQQNLTFNDVWMGFDEPIQHASARYGVDVVLVGRALRKAKRSWDVVWKLYQAGDIKQWRGRYPNKQELMHAGIASAYEHLFDRYAPPVDGAEKNEINIEVVGVLGLNDFVRLVRYLKSLPSVRAVQWSEVNSDVASFSLKVQGGTERLQRSLALGNVLQVLQAPENSDILPFRFIP